MGSLKLQTGSIATLLGTELNSLAGGGSATASSAYDNTPAGGTAAFFGNFELVAGFAAAPSASTTVDLYLIASVDGTNYADGAGPPPTLFVGSFVCQAGTSQRLALVNVPLPPLKFKACVVNNSGQALAASGNTVKLVPAWEQY